MHRARHLRSWAGVNTKLAITSTPYLRAFRAFTLTVLVGVGGLRASERWATLEAIHQLENPRNSTKPGPFGELGAYQFRASTWQMHTAIPFEKAHDRAISDKVAITHYDYLRRGLIAAGVSATPYNIALAWNSGLGAVIGGRSPRVAHQYASRAANLVGGFAAKTPAKPAARASEAIAPAPASAPEPVYIYFAGIPSGEGNPAVSFQWAGSRTATPRIPDFNAAFPGNMRVSLTE